MSLCIFCEMAIGKRGDNIVYEDEYILALNDINPKAPVHLLILPKKHIESVNELSGGDKDLFWRLFELAKKMAKEKNIEQGYKLIFNVGRKGGQIIDHLHLHLLGGY
ncbi:MAG: histidine triad nucleotide-binding protein [Parcubacteria group bacterium GW2011_GWA2_38_13b]|nr:MAG: histidine triad nucleotide-binding protein [Parcubacteria group bacterium GW2011_GWA2_38_13b]